MGRGAYDTTDASKATSSAGEAALEAHQAEKAEASVEPHETTTTTNFGVNESSQRMAAEDAAAAADAKAIKNHKSRGIMVRCFIKSISFGYH
jgi:hypothetical protein